MAGPTSASAKSRARARTAFCSPVSSKSTATPSSLHRGADVFPHEADDVLRRGARREQLLDPEDLEGPDVLRRDDAASEDRDVLRALLAEQLQHAGEQIVVGAREHR